MNLETKVHKILVVDDNQFIRKTIKYLLRDIFKETKKHFIIVECCDGIDTLKMIMEDQKMSNAIKCIITDELMEFMDGSLSISILRSFEQKNKVKNVFIISMSSFDDDLNRINIHKSGADAIITKPCSKYILKNLLDKNGIL